MRRPRFTIRSIMIATIWCALLLAAVRIERGRWLGALLLFIVGPILGVIVQRLCGGRGVLGGVIGGVATYVGFGAVIYLRMYFNPKGIPIELVESVGAIVYLAFRGSMVGLAIGILVSGLMGGPERRHTDNQLCGSWEGDRTRLSDF